ncbi:MAG: TrmH family RNA methyltransferase [Patescibacteria group bacterium]
MEVAVLLHNIRSTHNVGSIFRTADAAGVSRVYLTGYTPTPTDRFGRARKDIAKTALGAEKFLPWEHYAFPPRLIARLKNEGWRIVGVEQDVRARDYRKFKAKSKTVFVFGNEVSGIPKGILKLCDAVVEIPMQGAMVRQAHHPRHSGRGKESLNVSVAAGIILFSCISYKL